MKLAAYIFVAAILALGAAAWAFPGGSPMLMRAGTVTVAGAGANCPGAGPTQAVNAGFTTLAKCYDFSQPSYATLSNWIDCTGNGSSTDWYWQNNSNVPCNSSTIKQTADGSVTAMAVIFPVGTAQPGSNVIATINNSATYAVDFGNAYYETTVRYNVGTGNTLHSLQANWLWATNTQWNQKQPPSFACCAGSIEQDIIEMAAPPDSSDQAIHFWNNGGGGFVWQGQPTAGFVGNLNPTLYHKYGLLRTSNGTNDIWSCYYIDDIMQKCFQAPTPADANYLANRNFLEIWTIVSNSNPTEIVNTAFSTLTQFFRVWSCANWNNGSQGSIPYNAPTAAAMCNGSTLVSGSSSTPTYYH